jgi:hypothetical protein
VKWMRNRYGMEFSSRYWMNVVSYLWSEMWFGCYWGRYRLVTDSGRKIQFQTRFGG